MVSLFPEFVNKTLREEAVKDIYPSSSKVVDENKWLV